MARCVARRSGRSLTLVTRTAGRQPLLVLDGQMRVVTANQAFFRSFFATPRETLGRRVYDLGHRQWDVPELRELLDEIVP